jgi:hypothetical protein
MLSQYIYVRRTKGPSLYHSYFFLTNWHTNLHLQISRNKDRPIPSPPAPLLAGLFFIGCDLWILNFGKPFLWESDVNFSRPVLSTLRPFTACSRPVYGLQFSTAKFIFIRPVLSYFAVATATWQHWGCVAGPINLFAQQTPPAKGKVSWDCPWWLIISCSSTIRMGQHNILGWCLAKL